MGEKRGRGGVGAMGAVLAVVAVALIAAPSTLANPGDLDPSFGAGGVAFSPPEPAVYDFGAALRAPLALQSDDRPITTQGTARLVRFGTDGTLDGSFSGSGGWDAPVGDIIDLTVDPQDRIAVLLEDGTQMSVARLLSDGSPDPAFGVGGHVELPDSVGADGSGDGAVATDADGGMAVVAGTNALVRLTPGGQLDSGFSDDGVFRSPTVFSPRMNDVVVRDDGRILVLEAETLEQVLPDGAPDPTFGQGGYAVLCCLGPGSGEEAALVIRPDGTAYGQESICRDRPTCQDLYLVGPGGTVDEAAFPAPLGGRDDDVGELALDQAGRLFATAEHNGVQALSAVSISPGGFPDPAWGRGGFADAFPRGCGGYTGDIAVDSQGRVLLAGRGCGEKVLVRLRSDPGPADADADGRLDEADRCTLLPSPDPWGCPTTRPRIFFYKQEKRGDVRGLVEAPRGEEGLVAASSCARRVRVTLWRAKLGKDAVVGRDGSRGSRSNWRIRRSVRPGRYYATTRSRFAPPIQQYPGSTGRCLESRSRTYRVR